MVLEMPKVDANADLFLLELLAILTISDTGILVGWPLIPILAFVRSASFKAPMIRCLSRTIGNVLLVPTNFFVRWATHRSNVADWSLI